jgi:hypothetical protein
MGLITRIVIILHLALRLLPGAAAQNVILPPEIRCIKNDTVFWNLPVNTCGPFQRYLVFASTSPTGPFNLIATINDPSQTQYYHNNPGNQIWYYYMQADHNCPGFIRLNSDTISSAAPPQVPIRFVTVAGDQVLLRWDLSEAPQVDRYIIYRNTPAGTIPIDTVFGGNTYTDLTANPGNQSEIYYIVAADDCGNVSLFDVLHQSIYMTAVVEDCARSITLTWNPYVNWQQGTAFQVIWAGLNGAAPQPLDTLPPNASSFVLQDVDAATEYCLTVRAYESGTGFESRSNALCLLPDIVQPPRQMQIKYISINANEEVTLEWVWEDYAELQSARIERSTNGLPFALLTPVTLTTPLQGVNFYTDSEPNPSEETLAYRIYALDDCDDEWLSPVASPILLRAIARPDQTNELSWSALELPGAIIEGYEVFEWRNGLIFPLGTTPGLGFEHPISTTQPVLEPLCYLVEASYRIDLPGGQERRISRSNIACALQEARIWVPNAFAPRGLNTSFRPLILFADRGGYEMTVYNRWGGEVFRSVDLGEGWNGQINGADAPQGVYTWVIRVRDAQGNEVLERGTVMLVR